MFIRYLGAERPGIGTGMTRVPQAMKSASGPGSQHLALETEDFNSQKTLCLRFTKTKSDLLA